MIYLAAVLCSAIPYSSAGVRLGLGMAGKLGHARVSAWVGAWVVYGVHDGDDVVGGL